MSKKELTREERYDWLVKTARDTMTGIPWDRMAIPHHEWMDEVLLEGIDARDFTVHKARVVNVPRYREDVADDMWMRIRETIDYRTNRRNKNKDE
jgi:hypothetical protein